MTVARETILSVDHVGMQFGGLVALSDLNFCVGEGEILSLIGRTAPARPRRSI